jgi:phosphoribosylglycinamide formyltransferase-1
MYGRAVHEAVLKAGEKVTGVTIHLVNEAYDEGRILAQAEVPVLPDDNVESLAARVLKREHAFLVETLRDILNGKLVLPGM